MSGRFSFRYQHFDKVNPHVTAPKHSLCHCGYSSVVYRHIGSILNVYGAFSPSILNNNWDPLNCISASISGSSADLTRISPLLLQPPASHDPLWLLSINRKFPGHVRRENLFFNITSRVQGLSCGIENRVQLQD